MSSLNKIILIGRVEQSPEVNRTQGGTAVANFPLTTTEHFKGRDGTNRTRQETHRITVWGKLAERVGEYANAGAEVLVEGSLGTETRRDSNGNTQTRPKITAYSVLKWGEGGGGAGRGSVPQPFNSTAEETGPGGYGFTEDDLPY